VLSEVGLGLTNMKSHLDGKSCAVFTSNSRRWRQFSSCAGERRQQDWFLKCLQGELIHSGLWGGDALLLSPRWK
jgi:hypothetical protein